MRPKELPQAVLARWLDFQERVEALEAVAREAEAEVDHLRHVLSSKSNDVTAEQFGFARDNFQRIYTSMQTKRVCANTQAKLLSTVKAWIEKLPDNTRISMVQAPVNSIDPARVRSELKEAREKLRLLRGTPPASSDIGKKIAAYVAELARAAAPAVRGFSQGQTLAVQWPNDAYDGGRNIGLLLHAVLDPDGVASTIMRAVTKVQPLSEAEHAEKVADLERRIDELGYVAASLAEKGGAEYDDALLPTHILNVRIGEETAVAAE